MRIRKLTATFGCLDGAVLEPGEGLNTWVLPNESGKSTWAAFLVAMFYGIDTARRSTRGRPAEKTRYQPWSGKPMAGTAELEWEGRVIVLQRTSERGRPMGAFRAYDKKTGLDVPELTAETCGESLLGVRRSVFERTALLRGSELAVSQDQELARRLGALAASGSREDSYPEAENRLKQWQNRCRYHQTGRIPETEAALAQAEQQLQTLEALRRSRQEKEAELTRTREELARTEADAGRRRETRREQLRKNLREANEAFEIKQAKVSALPDRERLEQMLWQLQRALPEEDFDGPDCPAALQDLEAEEILPRAQADARRCRELEPGRRLPPGAAAALGLVMSVFTGILLWRETWWWLLPLAGALALLVYAPLEARYRRLRRQERTALLQTYGAGEPEELVTLALAWRDRLQVQKQWQQASWEQELILEEVRTFAPETQSLWEMQEALELALRCYKDLDEAGRLAEQAQLQWLLEEKEPSNEAVEDLRRQAAVLQTEAAGQRRQEQTLGDPEQLQGSRQALTEELQALTRREQALILAREALGQANEQMTEQYAPRLTGLAGQYLSRLTGGRYEGLLLTKELELSVRERESGLVRPLAFLSRGTQDQTWLALRLAMTALLLPEGTPLVLDDALLTFDEAREEAARKVLREENRQVLLFSCR